MRTVSGSSCSGDVLLPGSISDQLVEDLKQAMRGKDTQRRDVIRYLRSALVNRGIELRRELDDDDVLAVIRTQIKQSSDAADIFRSAERQDLADKEEAQIAILREYLPAQMPESEVADVAQRIIDEQGLSGPGDMGKLMPPLLAEIGDRAEGRVVSQAARDALTRQS